jgi:hypothetical protein
MSWITEHREPLLIASRKEALQQVPSLPPSKEPEVTHQPEQTSTQAQRPEGTQRENTVVFGAEPPPIMLQHAGTENPFQPAEVLPLEPRDETPISGQPLARKPRIQLGFASRQDENGVAQDKGLMGWIDEQRARHKK